MLRVTEQVVFLLPKSNL